MKKLAPLLLAAIALLGVSRPLSAASNPPYHLTTVSWIVSTKDNMDVDDRYVTLIGRITGVAKNGDYIFTDGTGTILLDGADHVLPIGKKIVIGGRIDQAFLGLGNLEVNVKQWHEAKTP